jgi:hypothetical protein
VGRSGVWVLKWLDLGFSAYVSIFIVPHVIKRKSHYLTNQRSGELF